MCSSMVAIKTVLTTNGRFAQVSGGSYWRVCYAPEAAGRTYDQADLFRLRADSGWSEEVASQFVLLRVHGDIRGS